MFICPECQKEFLTESKLVKHYLSCWKAKHPFHQSKSAPRSEDIENRTVTDDVLSFFGKRAN